ncbi:hypothetical protein GCM10029964_069690 [Kibdelosporangium lantanae]
MNAQPGLSDVLPLSPLQQGLMFWASYGGAANDVYTVQKTLDLEGHVDPKALKAAAEALLRRYPNLRAGFRFRRSGEPVALVPAEVELPWIEVDLNDPAGVRAAIDAERARPFDLGRPPLVRFMLVKRSDTEFTLVFTHHHILLDGWSVPLLVRELFELYASAGSDVGMPPRHGSATTSSGCPNRTNRLRSRPGTVIWTVFRRRRWSRPGVTCMCVVSPGS